MKWIRFLDKRILIVAGVVILILLMMDFNSRMNDLSRLKSERDKLSTQEAQLLSTQQSLQTQIAYATSDVAVQDYARNDGKMAQPGDVVMVPVPGQGGITQPTPTPTVVTVQVENWQRWFALFFGQ